MSEPRHVTVNFSARLVFFVIAALVAFLAAFGVVLGSANPWFLIVAFVCLGWAFG